MTPQQLIWQAKGKPKPTKGWSFESASGYCATCGQPITQGVSRKIIESETYSQHADYMKYGDYDCPACAWLHSDPKNNHRNVIVAGSQIWWPMISQESATSDRPQWLDVLRIISMMSSETPITGCITTDPKPRLWPRYKLATINNFGLYVHAPDYDQSGYLTLNLNTILEISATIKEILKLKYSKRSVFLGLLQDYQTASKNITESITWERRLKEFRKRNEFIPALIITPVEKRKEKNESADTRVTGNIISSRAVGGGNSENSPRLL